MPPAGGLSTCPAHPSGSWLAVASVVGSLRRGWASWLGLGLSHTGQASSESGGLASPTGAGVRVALSFPMSLSLHSLKCRGRPSSHRRLCGSVAPSTARLVCVESAGWSRLRHPVIQQVLHTCPACFVLQVQSLRGLALRRCRFAQRAEAETARFACPEASTMLPFMIAALAPHSVSFADGPVLKFVLNTVVTQTVRGQAGKQARKLAKCWVVQLAVERVVLLLACLAVSRFPRACRGSKGSRLRVFNLHAHLRVVKTINAVSRRRCLRFCKIFMHVFRHARKPDTYR